MPQGHASALKRLAIGSIIVGLVVLALKSLAAWLTGSVALYSDAMESVVNVATAVVTYFAIRLSTRPADDNHPYGHQKAEYLSALFEALLIGAAAFAIISEAVDALVTQRVVYAGFDGLAINALSSVINSVWCVVLLRQGRALRSPALQADGRHLLSDVITSCGVIVGVLLARFTGLWWLDPLLALCVAISIVYSGWTLLKSSVSGLMDTAPPEDELERIRSVIAEAGDGAMQAHDLKVRVSGRLTFIDFHLIVPGTMTVMQSHAICDRIEDALRQAVDGAQIAIHVEPEYKAKEEAIPMQTADDV